LSMAPHLLPLDQQTIVITGASSGIGLATARAAAKRGAKVVLAARDEAALQTIAAELREGGAEAEAFAVDVSDEAGIKRLAEFTINRFGRFDTWVNNAGVGVISPVEKTSSADHRRVFDVNYFGLVYGSLAAVRHFRETDRSGAIINLGSAVSDMPMLFSVAYSASKHAIKGFTDGLRVEIMHEKLPISVTLIKPSGIDTRFFDHAATNLDGIGKAPGPTYAPSVVADAILHAAEHPKRDIAVGSTAAFGGPAATLLPSVVEASQAISPEEMLIDHEHTPEGENLYDVPSEGHERSRYGHGRSFSLTTMAQTNPGVVVGASLLLGAVVALGLDRYRRG
jgi:short-subunit dehydrogenase